MALNVSGVACNDERIKLILKYQPSLKCHNKNIIDKKNEALEKCNYISNTTRFQCDYIGEPNLREVHVSLLILIPSTIAAIKLIVA